MSLFKKIKNLKNLIYYNKYHAALRVLIYLKKELNIVIVGANDGKTNDPIYDFNISRKSQTHVLLIEPNKLLVPFLEENYSVHPSFQIANSAIGEEGTLVLYAIKPDLWESFQPDYATGWPSYRAATGFTSAIKSHVENALTSHGVDPNGAVEEFSIPAKELKTLLSELKWKTPIDVLQIDAEGYDDVVIFSSSLSLTKPKIIYFECDNMQEEKVRALYQFLSKHQYKIYEVGRDSFAVYCSINITSILLNFVMFMHNCAAFFFKAKKLIK